MECIMLIDTTTGFGKRVARRLQEEPIIWLTTVSSQNIPQPRPVWFLWDGESLLVYSQANAYKLAHIARNPQVALNLDGDGRGGDIIVLTGEAHVDHDAPPATQITEYLDKYRDGIARIQMTPESFAREYSVAIRIVPQTLRGH
jgi:PPOX class probable F420-dependent enzyme